MLKSSRLLAGHYRHRCVRNLGERLFSSSETNSAVAPYSVLKTGDRVLLSWVQSKELRKKLSKPLRRDEITIVNNYEIPHNELIGQQSYTYLEKSSKDGTKHLNVLAQHPSLDEFVALSPRKVAPIYASYASSIVDLLDIHVYPPSAENDPKTFGPSLQILEAGTGHGSLTLHLSRAIAGANPPPPRFNVENDRQDDIEVETASTEWNHWRAERRAILHTVEVEKRNSRHASDTIRTFRGGLYWPHIDFHAGNVQDWLMSRALEGTHSSQLDAVVLDMPNVHETIEYAVKCLKLGGRLLTFTPQITQIAQGVQIVKDKGLPLVFDGALELGDGISTGRLWDVRVANIRAEQRLADEVSSNDDDSDEGPTSPNHETSLQSSLASQSYIRPMVCRPRVFERTRGGGFVGIWRKRAVREDKRKASSYQHGEELEDLDIEKSRNSSVS